MLNMLTLGVLLQLNNQLSAPLNGVQQQISALQGRINGAAQATRNLSASMRSAGASLVVASGAMEAITGAGLKDYISTVVDVEHRLAALGNTANIGAEALSEVDNRLSEAAVATNQFKSDLLSANEILIAAGMEWKTALDITPIIGKTATASQAVVTDIAKAGDALVQNMKINVTDMESAFNRLVVAGESGKFELKDMAQYLPKLGSGLGAMNFTGIDNVTRMGAALQIAFKGAGSADEAANNMQNFLAKLSAPDVQKNFADFGVDIVKELKDAQKKGLDLFIVAVEAVQKATGGDAFKLGEIFGDMQVQNFIKPMMEFKDEYKQLVQDIGAKNGKIEQNFARIMGTTSERFKQFKIRLSVVDMPWVNDLIEKFGKLIDWMNANPVAVGWIVQLTAGAGALGIALAVVGGILNGVAAALAFAALPMAPLIAAFAALAVGIWWAWKNWDDMIAVTSMGIEAFMHGVDALATAISSAIGNAVNTALAWVMQLRDNISMAIGDAIDAVIATLSGFKTAISSAISDVLAYLTSVPERMIQAGKDIGAGLVNGIKQGAGDLWQGAKDLANNAVDGVTKTLGIQSPSRVMMALGQHTIEGLRLGLMQGQGGVLQQMGAFASKLGAPLLAGSIAMGGIAAPAMASMSPMGGIAAPAMASMSPMGGIAAYAPNNIGTAQAPINITINVQGNADPKAIAQDVEAAVRRALERRARQDALARNARQFD